MLLQIGRLLKRRPPPFTVMTVAALAVYPASAQARPGRDRPNVVFILADDLGWGDIAPYGQKVVPTPNLDRLTREGMRFTQHYAGSTVCSPSRASLMLGRDTGHQPIRGNKEVKSDNDADRGQAPLPDHSFTLATLFHRAGYATAAIGKWGLGSASSMGAPWAQGFDYFFGYLDQRAAHSYFPQTLWRNDKQITLDNPKIPLNARLTGDPSDSAAYLPYVGRDYSQERMTQDALAYLAKQAAAKKPFFLYLAYTLPHAAMQLPLDERDRFHYLPEAGPYLGKPYTPQQFPRAARAAMVARLDADVGRVLAALEKQGLARNTLVVFTSDNGPTKEGGQDMDFFNSNGGLRGYKRDLYEGGIRVPLIVRWPGHIPAGRASDVPTAFWDYMKTFAALLHVSAPSAPEAKSFLPVLLGGRMGKRPPLYWEFHGAGSVPHAQAVRMGRWKAVRLWPATLNGPAPIELYDLASDPSETKDVAAAHPEVIRRAVRYMNQRTRADESGWNFDPGATGEDE